VVVKATTVVGISTTLVLLALAGCGDGAHPVSATARSRPSAHLTPGAPLETPLPRFFFSRPVPQLRPLPFPRRLPGPCSPNAPGCGIHPCRYFVRSGTIAVPRFAAPCGIGGPVPQVLRVAATSPATFRLRNS
jgi:hypothetical protein